MALEEIYVLCPCMTMIVFVYEGPRVKPCPALLRSISPVGINFVGTAEPSLLAFMR